jgi:hypothetical protein
MKVSFVYIYIKDKTIVTAQQKRGMGRSEKRYMKIEKVRIEEDEEEEDEGFSATSIKKS